MAASKAVFLAFNRGLVSPLALARMDVKRLALSAEEMTNWVPRVLGSMMLRPGLEYVGSSKSDAAARYLPFVFSTSDKALLEFTDSTMRVWIDDALVTRPSVTSAVSNGNFDSNLTGWTDNDEVGGASDWVAGGYMGLTGNGTAAAIRDQQVTVPAASQNVEHALKIVVQRGPVILRVGSTSGGDEYISEATLLTGTHSLAFTPTGSSFYIRFLSRLKRQVLVDSCNVESAGAMEVAAPWVTADLGKIRAHWDISQSADVVFVACEGYCQRRIERRSTRSWSVVKYEPNDGPFMAENTGAVTIAPSGLSGNITLTASAALFKSTNVGGLYSITSQGQTVTQTATAQNTFTNAIRVTGVDATRVFSITVTGLSGTGSTVTLQRSLESDTGPWSDAAAGYTTDQSITFDDGLDNQIAWYRIGVKTGGYSAGTIVMTLTYTVGSIRGVVRVTAFATTTSVSAEVLTELGGTSATDQWAEGSWSDRRGWPTCVALVEGRLAWAGKNGVWLSVSDAFDSFNPDTEGDSGPINRTIGSGPVDRINFLLPLQRLILGAEGAEFSCKSSSLDEPLTATNFNIKDASTQGSAAVPAIKLDKRGIFVQRGGTRVFDLSFGDDYEYGATHLSALTPEIGQPSITRVAIQRQPDTRVHFVRSDGTAALLIYDKVENVTCWCEVETASGDAIEDVAIVPGDAGTNEDQVYYHMRRTVNGSTKRYLEKWALESECQGGTLNKQLDSFTLYSGSAASTISVAHLEGRTVAVWGDGVYLGTYTVSGGQITVSQAVSQAVIGLVYTARWKSAKPAFATAFGIPLNAHKIIKELGVVLYNTHATGLRYGPSFDHLQDLPGIEEGKPVGENDVRSSYDHEPFTFPGEWSTDSRLCLQAIAPKPCTILAATCDGEVNA